VIVSKANEMGGIEPSIGLADPAQQKRLSPSAIAAFVNIVNIWSLKDTQALGLLGAATPATLLDWKTENEGSTLDQNTLTRISYLIGIYKALNICHGQELADSWVTLPNQNPIFRGKTPVGYMIENGQPGLAMVRRLLDARCQGQ
jgi:hypothetical protein